MAGGFNVEILAKPVGADTEPLVGGRVVPPAGASLNGCTIELVNQQSKWRSGKLALNETGAFQITARAEKGVQNIFALELGSASGALLAVTPAQFTYTVGVVVEEQLIIGACSLLWCWIVMRTRSLWPVYIGHMIIDLIMDSIIKVG